jgi:ATP-binding cassette, subfamily B, bacterial
VSAIYRGSIALTLNPALLDKLNRFRAQLPYLPRTCQLVWVAAQSWTVAWAILLVLQGVLPVATVYLTRALVDSLSLALRTQGDWQTFQGPILWVALLASVMLLQEVLSSAATWVRTGQAERVQDSISGLIHAQATTLDLAFYETPDYHDRLYRAHIDALYRPVALLENLGNLVQSGLTFVAMAGILLTFGWWVPLALLVGVLPALVMVAITTWREVQWQKQTTPDQRRASYYHWLMTNSEAAAELRLFGLGLHFRHAFQQVRQRLRSERITLAREHALAELAAGGLALLTTALVMVWLIGQALQGAVTLGGLAMFYQAFNQGQQFMRILLRNVAQIYSNILFLENLFEFLALEPQLLDPVTPIPAPRAVKKAIRFHNVTFCYPGSEHVALEHFDLTIPAGQITAIVGENGAGKSTLIKLLCRFYDPAAGQITLDGVDLRQFAQAELRRLITVLFQQPVHYHASAGENIALGELTANPTAEEIERAAEAAGAAACIERLPESYATLLGKWFGGAELSGGEWQRVALARAFLRQAPIIVLDEPTSALDSWAEANWMARFRTLAKGRTALIITHRFTTALQADTIHVMEAGQIVESGTHQELLARGGRYAQSWQQQMQSSRSGAVNASNVYKAAA